MKCEMTEDCTNAVTHIGSKGYIYCQFHGQQRRESGYERIRKMTASEKVRLATFGALARY